MGNGVWRTCWGPQVSNYHWGISRLERDSVENSLKMPFSKHWIDLHRHKSKFLNYLFWGHVSRVRLLGQMFHSGLSLQWRQLKVLCITMLLGQVIVAYVKHMFISLTNFIWIYIIIFKKTYHSYYFPNMEIGLPGWLTWVSLYNRGASIRL